MKSSGNKEEQEMLSSIPEFIFEYKNNRLCQITMAHNDLEIDRDITFKIRSYLEELGNNEEDYGLYAKEVQYYEGTQRFSCTADVSAHIRLRRCSCSRRCSC